MKTTRRKFLRNMSAAAAGMPLAAKALHGKAGVPPVSGESAIDMPAGRMPDSQIPDTLDLVEKGKLALNGLAGTLDWGAVPEFYFRVEMRPPKFIHDRISFAACGPKYWEAFVMLRAMTGSDAFQELQDYYRRYMLSCIAEDGLFYCKIGLERPWDTSSPEDYANIYGQGRMIRAMLAEHDADGNPEWLARARKMGAKLAEIGIYKDDYVYYPDTPGYGDMFSYPKSGWKVTELRRGGPEFSHGSAFGIPMYMGGTILPLVRLAERAQDERMMELAEKLTRFLMLPGSAWKPTEFSRGINPGEHAEYRGQTHSHVMTLRGILAVGVATNNTNMKIFAREGYEFSRKLGIAPLGWFEEEVGNHSHETCTLADMTSLALQLTEAGVGDYWDDLDGYARNHMVEGQFTDLEKLKRINPNLTAEQEKMLERVVGTYAGWGSPVALNTNLQNCCMANQSQALYSVWASSVQYDHADASARVNLLLNRTSPWIDVESHLPFEGKVILRNKALERVYVRIPGWVDRGKLQCFINGQPAAASAVGNYLPLIGLPRESVVTLTFPLKNEVRTFTLENYGEGGWGEVPVGTYRYRATFKANTAIELVSLEGDQTRAYDPRVGSVSPVYPAYDDRGAMSNNAAPTKNRTSPPKSLAKVIRSW
jgi:hypothetical protein